MADNVGYTPGSGAITAADEVSFSGDTAKVQVIRPVHVGGSEGSKTLADATGLQGVPSTGSTTVQDYSISTLHRVAAGSGDAVNVKASAGRLRSVHVFNKSDVPIYVKFHNDAGTPTPGASVALTVGVQAGLHRDVVFPGGGRAFATGIAMSMVTGIADNSSAALTAGDAVVEVGYE